MPARPHRLASAMPDRWFDAHLDLAFLAETGRDMHADLADARGRYTPPAVTLRSMREDGVTACLGTVFTEAVQDLSAPDAETGAFAYPAGDTMAAYRAGMRQLKLYHAWRDAGLIRFFDQAIGEPREPIAKPPADPLRLGVLIENADPIPAPDELEQWEGVVAVGLAWAVQGRYAAGNTVPSEGPGTGLTDLGRRMVARIDELGLVHDLSHLNDRAADELLDLAAGRVMASHSNARALLDGKAQRHLTDDHIKAITAREGIIGLNLYSSFLTTREGRATLEDAADHIEHICAVAGDRSHVGLGSDIDGGFSSTRLPDGVTRHADLGKLANTLAARSWSDDEINGFAHANWARFWKLT